MSGPLSDATLEFLVARTAAQLGMPIACALELLENPENLEYLRFMCELEGVTKTRASPHLAEFIDAACLFFGAGDTFLARTLVAPPVPRPALDAVVQKIAGRTAPKFRAHALGAFLRNSMGRSVNGWHIEQVGDVHGSALWALVPAE